MLGSGWLSANSDLSECVHVSVILVPSSLVALEGTIEPFSSFMHNTVGRTWHIDQVSSYNTICKDLAHTSPTAEHFQYIPSDILPMVHQCSF